MGQVWAFKTGAQVIYAARSLCNDVDPEAFATTPDMCSTLYRHALAELVQEAGDGSNDAVTVPFPAGALSRSLFSVATTMFSLSKALWNDETMERVDVNALVAEAAADLAGAGYRRGTPAIWGYAKSPLGWASSEAYLYPVPLLAGSFMVTPSTLPDNVEDTATTLTLGKSATQSLELLLACKMLRRMSPEAMARLGLGPNALPATEAEYSKRLGELKWENGRDYRKDRVVVARRRGR